MKSSLIFAATMLPVVAWVAFGFATLRRESDVAMHLFSDEAFARMRLISMTLGVAASILELLVLAWLYRRRSR